LGLLGTIALYAAMWTTVIAISLNIAAGRSGTKRLVNSGRFASFAASGFVFTASAILLHALLTHDFSIQYVASFSDKSMPLFYLIGAFWGGQAGSLLFWVAVISVTLTLCLNANKNRYQDLMPWVAVTSLSVMLGLLFILVFVSNPFEAFHIIDDPTIGKGLNPLLQTPKMVIHPPSLLAGLASMTIPFGFAIAALITKNFSNAWVIAARSWILVPWFFLSIGNMLGGMWAYEELGWGGYWAWDAVENAAFMPWMMVTALIHSLMIQERRSMLKRWNVALMIFSFLLTVFGTYITRSGLIQSVHTFAQSGIGNYFLAFLMFFSITSLGLFVWRWPSMKSARKLDSPVSREAAFIFNNWLFITMTAIVFFGTLWPRAKEFFWDQEVAIGPMWFNRWMVPMGLILLALMGVGTAIAWRKATMKNFKKNFVKPILFTLVASPSLIWSYWHFRGQFLGIIPSPNDMAYSITAVVLIIFATAVIFEETFRGVNARRKMHDETLTEAIVRLTMKQRRRYGGYVIHLGMLCAYLAFAGNAMKIETDVSLKRGESVVIGDYTLHYLGLTERNDPEKLLVMANISVEQNGKEIYKMYPGKAKFYASPMSPTSEIDIKSSPLEDLYVALVNHDASGNTVALKVFIGPFTWWFWFGGLVLVFGTLITMWPTRENQAPSKNIFGKMAKIAVVTAVLLLTFAPLGIMMFEANSNWGNAKRIEKHMLMRGEIAE